MRHPNEPTIPQEVLAKIGEHRPHLQQLIANIPNAPAQCEKALADAYLQGETRLSGIETWRLGACSAGRGYGEGVDGRHGNPGRPVGSGEGRTVTFRLKLTPEERRRLDEMAQESGETPSQLVRRNVFGE